MKLFPLILAIFICPVQMKQAFALDIFPEFSTGYNDNVPKTPEAEGSGFCLYEIRLVQPLFSGFAADGQISAQGAYQDYFRTEDNYRLQAGTEMTFPLNEGRILPGIFSDVLIFRDNLLEEDDRNEVTAGAFADWLVNPYLTLGIRQNWAWADYRNAADTCRSNLSQKPEHAGGKGMNSSHICTALSENQSRDDTMQNTDIHGIFYLRPNLQTEMLAEHIRNDSSETAESYKENALTVSLAWNPSKAWELSVLGSARHLDYEQTLHGENRKDNLFHALIRVSRFIGKFELRVQAQWTDNDSSEEKEEYRQQVMQCGLGFSF